MAAKGYRLINGVWTKPGPKNKAVMLPIDGEKLKGYPVLYIEEYTAKKHPDDFSRQGYGTIENVGVDPVKLAVEEMVQTNEQDALIIEYRPVAARKYEKSAKEVKEYEQ